MRVIVSTELQDVFNNYVVVDSFRRVKELQGITTLIIHKYRETDFDAGVLISELHNTGIDNFIYINSTPSSTIRMVINGVGGAYYEDEFYLEDEEELNTLLEEMNDGENGETYSLAAPALNVVSEFIESFARGEERIKAPIYLERVTQAVNELTEVTHQQELQITAMSTNAIEVFEKASTIIKSMDTQRKLIEKRLEDLEAQEANNTSNRLSFGNSINFFSPYKFMGNSRVLLIREYSHCRYLSSFVLGYLHHLHYELNKRAKLVFVHQKGQGVAAKYNDYTSITQESMNMASLYDAEIVATNNPKKEVMRDLLMKPLDVVVVVDRLYGNQDIVSGRVVKVNAVGSRSDINRYHINPDDTIFSVTAQPKQLFTIPTIKQFPTQTDARYAIYSQVMGDNYKILDKKLGI